MNQGQVMIKTKADLLDFGKQMGDVSQTCRAMGSPKVNSCGVLLLTALGLFAMSLLAACSKRPVAPELPPIGRVHIVDGSPTWSPAGGLIAFHRRVFSSLGPPGLYVVPSSGGVPRHVAQGNFFWPTNIRFSPDANQLAFVRDLQLYVADLHSATETRLSTDLADFPDWSPDGRYIVYSSQGLHLYDLTTGIARPIPASDTDTTARYYATYPRWSPDGRYIAMVHGTSQGSSIALIAPDGRGYRLLSPTPFQGASFRYLRWFSRPVSDMYGLLYFQLSGPGAGPRFVPIDGKPPRPFAWRFTGPNQDFSPGGAYVVKECIDPGDSSSVLCVQRVEDYSGITRRQLTHWDPPPD